MELPNGIVDEYAVKIIIENIIDQFDYQGWDTGMLEELVEFRCNLDVAIPTGEQAYKNMNGIQRSVITTKGWGVQVKWRYQSNFI